MIEPRTWIHVSGGQLPTWTDYLRWKQYREMLRTLDRSSPVGPTSNIQEWKEHYWRALWATETERMSARLKTQWFVSNS